MKLNNQKRTFLEEVARMRQLMGLPLLTEGAVDRYIEKLIMNNMDDRMRPYFNMTLNEIYQQNPNIINQATMTQADLNQVLEKYGNTRLKDYIRLSICQLFDIRHGKGPVKYMKGIFRIVIEELKYLQNPNMQAINRLKDTVMYIQTASQEGDQDALQVDSNLNGWSFDQVTNVFKEKRKAFFNALRNKFASFNGGKSRYTKVVINSHEDARQFKGLTSWCITYDSSANYDQYTQGGRRFYVFLRDDYKQLEESVGKGCPLDDYGLSMLAVLVDMDGNITQITTRWNHEHNGEFSNISQETMETIQRLTNINFVKECPPYNREELRAMGMTPFDEVQEMLDSGVPPEELLQIVGEFREGCVVVELNDRYNFLTRDYKILSPQWFDDVYRFFEGFAMVELNDKSNYLTREGKILSPQWFDYVHNFSDGFARVELNGKWNFLTREGEILSPQWFDGIFNFFKGFARVELNGKWTYLTREGKIL